MTGLSNKSKKFWIARDYEKCSGCRRCEIACSLYHENRIWPEASRIRVFMLVPGAEFPHFCVQCQDYPCVNACPENALSVSQIGAVIIDKDKCIGCGQCIDACPGKIPHLHPIKKYALICNLCNGDPQCVKVCREGGWNTLKKVNRKENMNYRKYAKTPEDLARELAFIFYGEKAEEIIPC
jgi:Fe-S-cluster-containing hydrogenase component 2